MSQIRAALGDDPDAPRFVETLRGRGYRFIETGPVPRVPQVPPVPQVPVRRLGWIGLAAALVLAPIVWTAASSGRQEPWVAIASFDASSGSEEWSRTLRAQIVTHLAHGGTRIVDAGAARPGGSGSWYLDARVDRSPEQYRVTVLLHDPTGTVRFTDIFDGPPGDWIEAQNEMARIITQAVRYNVEGPDKVDGIERRVPRRKIPFS